MKKNKLLLLILLLLLVTGCTTKTESGTEINSKSDTSKSKGTLLCTRSGTAQGNAEVSLNYEVRYKKGYVLSVHSEEKIISNDSSILDQYEDAYKNIFKAYKDLKHYTNTVTRESNSVTSDTLIEYDKVDMNKLKEIENSDQSVIKDGKVALKDWLEFAEKFGTKCEEM